MTSRRAQRRDGTRKSRQVDAPHKQVILAKYAAERAVWARTPSAFRPAHPPLPPVGFTEEREAEPWWMTLGAALATQKRSDLDAIADAILAVPEPTP